jgi:uncharacterized repeat protein (TIGR03847 family)
MDFGAAKRFVVGAIGEPGNRVFMLQLVADGRSRWYVLEKGQVAALVIEARGLLQTVESDLESTVDAGELEPPAEIEFRVTEMRLGYSERSGMVTLLVAGGEADEQHEYAVTPGQLEAAAEMGGAAVVAGRPACPKCGLAMDPDGHICPTSNGDLRQHRP